MCVYVCVCLCLSVYVSVCVSVCVKNDLRAIKRMQKYIHIWFELSKLQDYRNNRNDLLFLIWHTHAYMNFAYPPLILICDQISTTPVEWTSYSFISKE